MIYMIPDAVIICRDIFILYRTDPCAAAVVFGQITPGCLTDLPIRLRRTCSLNKPARVCLFPTSPLRGQSKNRFVHQSQLYRSGTGSGSDMAVRALKMMPFIIYTDIICKNRRFFV